MTPAPAQSTPNNPIITRLLILLVVLLVVLAVLLPGSLRKEADKTSRIDSTPGTATATSAFLDTATPVASPTPMDTATPAPTATPLPPPCNQAAITIIAAPPNNGVVEAGQVFTPTWQLHNIGSCTWDADYALVVNAGDDLGGPNEVYFGKPVEVGDSLEISLTLTAPDKSGYYGAVYALRSKDGTLFESATPQAQTIDLAFRVVEKTVVWESASDPCGRLTWTSDNGTPTCSNESGPENTISLSTVSLLENPLAEGGQQIAGPAIVIRLDNASGKFVMGQTPEFTVQADDRFTAVIGCLDQGAACEVEFELGYTLAGETFALSTWQQVTDGSLESIELRLSDYISIGQKTTLTLTVRSKNGAAIENLVFWLEPQLNRYK